MSQSTLDPFAILKDQIERSCPDISESDPMAQCMEYFQTQFLSSFNKGDSSNGSRFLSSFSKDDSSMGSLKDSNNEVLAGEGQQIDDEYISLEDMDAQEGPLAKFIVSLEDLKKK